MLFSHRHIKLSFSKHLVNSVIILVNVKIACTVLLEYVLAILDNTESIYMMHVQRRKDLMNHVFNTQNVNIP